MFDAAGSVRESQRAALSSGSAEAAFQSASNAATAERKVARNDAPQSPPKKAAANANQAAKSSQNNNPGNANAAGYAGVKFQRPAPAATRAGAQRVNPGQDTMAGGQASVSALDSATVRSGAQRVTSGQDTMAGGLGGVSMFAPVAAAAPPPQPGEPTVLDMSKLNPGVPVSQSVASEALKQFNPAGATLPELQRQAQARLDLNKALKADIEKQFHDFIQREGSKYPTAIPHPRTGYVPPPPFANDPGYLAYRKTDKEYREKILAASELIRADEMLVERLGELSKEGGNLKPVGAYYASEMLPNMAYEVRLYERGLWSDGKQIGVELVDLTNPYDIRFYQGYDADPKKALVSAVDDYQFIRPLPQGTLAIRASGGEITYETKAGGVDPALVANNQTALAASQGANTSGRGKGSPGATIAGAYGAKTTFYMGIIPWTMAGAAHVSTGGPWSVIFPPAPGVAAGVSPGAYQPPGTWLAGFGAIGLSAGLMSFVNDLTSYDNNKVGPGFTILQSSRDLNAMYRSGAITATGLTAIAGSGQAPALANWVKSNQGYFNKLLPTLGPVKSVPLVGTATWFADAVLGTAATFAKFDGKTSVADIAKRNGQIASTWTNAAIQGTPFAATATAQFLTRNASAIAAQRAAAMTSGVTWTALALYTYETGNIQESRANGLGMVSATHQKGWFEAIWSPWAYGANSPVDPSFTVGGTVGKAVEDAKKDGAGFWGQTWAGASHLIGSAAKWYGKGLVLALAPMPLDAYRNHVIQTVGEKYINKDFEDVILSYARTDWKDPLFQHMYAEELARIEAIRVANQ